MKKYKAIIFDCDGTLLDTVRDLTNAVNAALRCVGLPEQTENDTKKMVGNGISVFVKRALGNNHQDLYDRAFPIFKQYYDQHFDDFTAPYPGIINMLEKLKKEGYLLLLVSNKNRVFLQKLYENFFADSIGFALGETEGLLPKPAPDMVEYILEKFSLQKNEVVYVGDSQVDIKTAQNVKIDGIFVAWGFCDKSVLINNGAKIIIDAPQQLVGLV